MRESRIQRLNAAMVESCDMQQQTQTVRETLERQRDNLTTKLAAVNAALQAIEACPEVENVLALVAKIHAVPSY